MPGKILGLDITEDSISAVQITGSLKGYVMTACAHVPVAENESPEVAVETLLSQMEFKSDLYHSALPSEKVSYRNLSLPFRDARKIRQALPFEIETMVPFPIDELAVDFDTVSRSENSDILAALVKKTTLSEHLELLRPYGVDPDIVDVRGIPTVLRLLKLEDTPDNGIYLHMDGKHDTFILFLERRIALVRAFPRVFDSDTQRVPPEPPYPHSIEWLKSLCRNIHNTIHSFGVQNHIEISAQKVFFTATQTLPSETAEFLKGYFGIPAEAFDISRGEKIQMDDRVAGTWNPALMGHALALALRDSRNGHGFNFRKNEFEKKKQYFGSRKEIRRAGIFALVLLCVWAANLGVDYYFLKQRNDALDQKIEEVFRATFPDIQRIVDPANQMAAEMNKIKDSAVANAAINMNESILDILKEISQRVPQSLDVHINRMVADPDSVRISGRTDSFNTVDRIKSDLEASVRFRTATISSAKLDKSGEKVEFEIKLERTAGR